jgi:hypothetical protein
LHYCYSTSAGTTRNDINPLRLTPATCPVFSTSRSSLPSNAQLLSSRGSIDATSPLAGRRPSVPFSENASVESLDSHLLVLTLPVPLHTHTFLPSIAGEYPSPVRNINSGPALSVCFNSVVAIATVHRSSLPRLERNFSFLTALGTYNRVHLPVRAVAETITSIPSGFPCLTAWETALRVILVTPGGKQFLFLSTEYEDSSAVDALYRFILKSHEATSSLISSWLALWSTGT